MVFDDERLARRGRLAEAEQETWQLGVKIEDLASSIRRALPAFAEIEELEAEKAATLAVELAGLHAEYVGLRQKVMAMRKSLGL